MTCPQEAVPIFQVSQLIRFFSKSPVNIYLCVRSKSNKEK